MVDQKSFEGKNLKADFLIPLYSGSVILWAVFFGRGRRKEQEEEEKKKEGNT